MEEQTTSQAPRFDKTKLVLPAAIIVAALLVSGTIFFTRGSDNIASIGKGPSDTGGEEQQTEVSEDDDPFIGSKKAKVVLVEFSDFQCPFCRRFWKETLPQIKENYIDTEKARFVYRDFPLDFHQGAKPAAEGSECARDQGKFWELHDKIFQEQDKQGQGTIQFTKADVVKWAGQIGLDMNEFNQCLDSGKYKAEVEKDYADGNRYGVSGTPTVFINERRIVGAQPFVNFQAVIEEELSK